VNIVLPKGRDANRLVYLYLTATTDLERVSALGRLVNHCSLVMARKKLFLLGKIGLLSTNEDQIGRRAETVTRWFIEEQILAWLRPWRTKSTSEVAEQASKGYFQVIERAVRHKLVSAIRHETTAKVGHTVLVRGEDGIIRPELPTIHSLNVPAFGEDEGGEGDEDHLIDHLPAKGSRQCRQTDVDRLILLYRSQVKGAANPQRSPAKLLAQVHGLMDGKPLAALRTVLWKRKPFPPLDTFTRGSETWPVPATDTATRPASVQAPKVIWYWLDSAHCIESAPTPPMVYTNKEALRDWRGRLPREVSYSLNATVDSIVATGEEARSTRRVVVRHKDRYVSPPSRNPAIPVGREVHGKCIGFEPPTDRYFGCGCLPLPSPCYLSNLIADRQDHYAMPYYRAVLKVLAADTVCHCGGCEALGTPLRQDRTWEDTHGFTKAVVRAWRMIPFDDKGSVWTICWPCQDPRKKVAGVKCWADCPKWRGGTEGLEIMSLKTKRNLHLADYELVMVEGDSLWFDGS
jgi:hypothetical protein